jgi:hypothetical protein
LPATDKALISSIYRELKNLAPQRINISMKTWAHELKKEFSKEEVQMASKYMKCSISLIIRDAKQNKGCGGQKGEVAQTM